MDRDFKKMEWEFDFCDENLASGQVLAVENGPRQMTDVVWARVKEIIVKLEGVEKEGQKIYKQLKDVPTKSVLGDRQLNELDDCLMHLDDEKNKLLKVYAYQEIHVFLSGEHWPDYYKAICI